MVVYMMDYYLPQILPYDKGTSEDTAAPIHYDPISMKMHYVRRDKKVLPPLNNGRLVAIRFLPKNMPQEHVVVFALIMDIALRNKPDWLKASSTGANVKDKEFGNTLYTCNPREFKLAIPLESLIPIFAPSPWPC